MRSLLALVLVACNVAVPVDAADMTAVEARDLNAQFNPGTTCYTDAACFGDACHVGECAYPGILPDGAFNIGWYCGAVDGGRACCQQYDVGNLRCVNCTFQLDPFRCVAR